MKTRSREGCRRKARESKLGGSGDAGGRPSGAEARHLAGPIRVVVVVVVVGMTVSAAETRAAAGSVRAGGAGEGGRRRRARAADARAPAE